MCKLVLLVGGRISKDKKLMQCKLNKLGFDMSKRYYTYSFLYYCGMALSVVYLCFVTTFFFFFNAFLLLSFVFFFRSSNVEIEITIVSSIN